MMKLRFLPAILCLALPVLGAAPATAQDGDPPPRQGGWKKPGQAAAESGLDPEEARRLAAAREKAEDDPTVRSLREARNAIEQQLDNAMRGAVLAADPGLAPTLEKVKESRNRAKGMRDRFESLTPEQRERLKSAREAAAQDPEVVAAREKMKSADSPEARREAGQAMRKAMKSALLKQNPDLAPLLEKLGPPRGPKGPPPGMEAEAGD